MITPSDEAVQAALDVLHERTNICLGADTCDAPRVARWVAESMYAIDFPRVRAATLREVSKWIQCEVWKYEGDWDAGDFEGWLREAFAAHFNPEAER